MDSLNFPPHISSAIRQSGYRIVITGAGGWLGLATLDMLSRALGEKFSTRVTCFGSRRRTLDLLTGASIEQRPLSELARLEHAPTLFFHLAFVTKERAERMDDKEYVDANRALSSTVLGSLDQLGAEAVFVASSGAARFAEDPLASRAMRLYGQLKREDEEAFSGWAENRQANAVIARIFNLSGPYINKHGNYALASFILDALAGRPIEIRATRKVVRTYVAIRELMALVFGLLVDKHSGVTRFDTGGEPMEMDRIAREISRVLGPVPVLRPELRAEPPDEYVGDAGTYARLLSNHGVATVAFSQQVSETARFFGERQASGWRHEQTDASSIEAH